MFLVAKALDQARDNGLPLRPGRGALRARAGLPDRQVTGAVVRRPGCAHALIETGVSVLKRSS